MNRQFQSKSIHSIDSHLINLQRHSYSKKYIFCLNQYMKFKLGMAAFCHFGE